MQQMGEQPSWGWSWILQIIELEKQVKCSFDKICATAETAKNADSEESIKKVKVLMVSPSSSSMGSDNHESKLEVDQASNKHHEPQQSQYEHQNMAHEW